MLYLSMQKFKDLKRELLRDHETKELYEAMAPEYEALRQIIELRLKHKLSQKQFAERIGTKQSAVSRFETGTISPTLGFLSKIAQAFGKKLVISFK